MSLKEIQKDFDEIIKPQLEEILKLLKNQIADNIKEHIEAAAAKIITEIRNDIHDYPCNKIVLKNDSLEIPKIISGKYSYPNHEVGNIELGSSNNPKSLTWPLTKDQTKL